MHLTKDPSSGFCIGRGGGEGKVGYPNEGYMYNVLPAGPACSFLGGGGGGHIALLTRLHWVTVTETCWSC